MEQRSPLQPTMPEKPLGIPLRTGSAYKTLQRLGDGKEEEEEGRREEGEEALSTFDSNCPAPAKTRSLALQAPLQETESSNRDVCPVIKLSWGWGGQGEGQRAEEGGEGGDLQRGRGASWKGSSSTGRQTMFRRRTSCRQAPRVPKQTLHVCIHAAARPDSLRSYGTHGSYTLRRLASNPKDCCCWTAVGTRAT